MKDSPPLWFKQAVIYQLHVKSFFDSNEDGIGEFDGLTSKLDYLKSLGITAVWLLPFYPSPLKDDGYDIADYFSINPTYGSLKSFKHFLKAAHELGIHVITELVINHTSDQHPWFQRARNSPPNSKWRDYYVWSDTPQKYQGVRIIFNDFETSNWTWDPIAKAYYWHRFYSHQPDLNFDNPAVQKEVFKALDFWFELGVDGLRLDAIPYLFEREGTTCENLPETHAFIKKFRAYVDRKFNNKVLIAEANQWPEDAAAYFGTGDECHMAFHFPVMPRLFMAIQMEDRFPIIDILEQTPELPATCQWVMFLRNHDELTLEMVSDIERDFMYRIYAKDPKTRINVGIRRRLAPLLDNDRQRIELMNTLLFSLPGTPVIYYGDEIGMGDNYYLGDRNGVRTPMQWSSDRNAGFSKANPQQLFLPVIIDPAYHYEVVNVENQEKNSTSLLWWIRRAIMVRSQYMAFGFGNLEFISSNNSKILAFTRTYENETILVVTNLSRFSQAAELDLSKYVGLTPIELFHKNHFPLIKEHDYVFTLGPYDYFWLELKKLDISLNTHPKEMGPLSLPEHWSAIFKGRLKTVLEKEILPFFLKKARWFEHKAYTIQQVQVVFHIPLDDFFIGIIEVSYLEQEHHETYLLPFGCAINSEAENIKNTHPEAIICPINILEKEGILFDALYSKNFRDKLIKFILNRKKFKPAKYALVGYSLEKNKLNKTEAASSEIITSEQSNSSFLYDQKYFFKLYRRLEIGIHPEVEMLEYITEHTHFKNCAQYVGKIQWESQDQLAAIGLLQSQISNHGTAWNFTLESLTRYYEEILSSKKNPAEITKEELQALIGETFLEATKILAERTAEMHTALSSPTSQKAFKIEPLSPFDQRSIYQEMRSQAIKTLHLIKRNLNKIPDKQKNLILEILKNENKILHCFQNIIKRPIHTLKMRIHGDFHLGQVLYTGKDFIIIDFEGEPLQTLSGRRLKKCATPDIAGMLRSFHYAAYKGYIKEDLLNESELWAEIWFKEISHLYLWHYLNKIKTVDRPIIPLDSEEFEIFLNAYLLDKAMYELKYELNNRPDWIEIPCKGILSLLNSTKLFL